MDHLMSLRNLVLAPYILKATALIGVCRKVGGTVALLFIAIILLLGIFGPIMYGAYCCH